MPYRISQTAARVDALRQEMEKLQAAIKRVGENWNDVVAQGIQTVHVNTIVSTCNSINSSLVGIASNIDADVSRMQELARLICSTSLGKS